MENNKFSTVYIPMYLKDIIKNLSQKLGVKQIEILSNAIRQYKAILDDKQPIIKFLKDYLDDTSLRLTKLEALINKLNDNNVVLATHIKILSNEIKQKNTK